MSELLADLAKKSGLLWIERPGATTPVAHEWIDDAVCLVVDGLEQPLADVQHGDDVVLLLRSKTDRSLVAANAARVEVVDPTDERWESLATTLRAGRLNLHDSPTALERWARDSRVLRLVPTGAAVRAR